jgi:hypothetical protein
VIREVLKEQNAQAHLKFEAIKLETQASTKLAEESTKLAQLQAEASTKQTFYKAVALGGVGFVT